MARGQRSGRGLMPRAARLALGTAQLGMHYGVGNRRGQPSAREAHRILASACDAGVEWLDTAPAYGEAEAVVGRFLSKANGAARSVRVCSKLPGLAADLPARDVRRVVAQDLDRSRRTLGRDTIDLYLVHQAGDLRRHGQMLADCLSEFRERGWIGRYGASVYAPAEARAAVERGVGQGIQYPFNLLDRRFVDSGCVAALRESGALSFARSALLQGVLGMEPAALPQPVAGARRYVLEVAEAARDYRMTPVAAAIAFAARESGADWIVVGADRPRQVAELAGALRTELPEELVIRMKRRLARVPARVRDPRRWAR